MSCHHGSNGKVFGALLGGLLVGGCIFLFTSKTGRKIRENLADGCNDLGEKLEKFTAYAKDTLEDNVAEFSEKAKERVNSVCDLENADFRQGLLYGSVMGALVSIGGVMMFKAACRTEEKTDILCTLATQASKWKKVLDEVTDAAQGNRRPVCETKDTISDVVDFAAKGLRLWQSLR